MIRSCDRSWGGRADDDRETDAWSCRLPPRIWRSRSHADLHQTSLLCFLQTGRLVLFAVNRLSARALIVGEEAGVRPCLFLETSHHRRIKGLK